MAELTSAELLPPLKALVARIEELDNPSDQGISQSDDCVDAVRNLIQRLEDHG